MFSNKGMYTYTETGGGKHKVLRVEQIKRGDHICFKSESVFYWHHAIVETAAKSNGEVNVIEYSNSSKQFSLDSSSPPKNPALAVVVRRKFNEFENESVYVIKHDRCFDPETVVSRAKSKLGERKYHPVTNNCVHFALWCKTGVSSSEQVNSVKDTLKTGVNDVTDTLNTGTWRAAVAANTRVKAIVKTEVSHEVTREFVNHTLHGKGHQIVSSGVGAMSKQLMTQTTVKTGQEVVKNGMTAMTKESNAGVLACAVAFESLFAAYDINSAYAYKKEEKIRLSEFTKTVGKEIVTGIFDVAGCTLGTAIGQVVIPVPVVGGFVGCIVGSLIGKAIGGLAIS